MYWLVMPAAGKGARMGEVAAPKQYLALAGRLVIEHALAPFLADARCRGAVVALAPDDGRFKHLAVASDPRVHTVTGGATRADSVRAALAAVAVAAGDEDPWVLVHDAARPCLARADLEALLGVLPASPDGALLAAPVADTVKRADAAGRVVATVARAGLWCAATPQAFRLRRLIAALGAAPGASDEAGAIEAAGGRPQLVAGSPLNLKLTRPGDLALAARILEGEPA